MREIQDQIEILSHCIIEELTLQLSEGRSAAKTSPEVALKQLDVAKRITSIIASMAA